MIKFKQYCEMRDYLSIGHDFDGNYDAWVLKTGSNNIKVASKTSKEDPEYFHDKYSLSGRLDFKGRIDHDKKAISIVPENYTKERLDYLVSILETYYPDYAIWLFSYGSPKKLN